MKKAKYKINDLVCKPINQGGNKDQIGKVIGIEYKFSEYEDVSLIQLNYSIQNFKGDLIFLPEDQLMILKTEE